MANVKHIISLIERLSDTERREIMRRLQLREEKPETRKITELRGLGKSFWQSIDVEAYIKEECKW